MSVLSRRPVPEFACLVWAAATLAAKASGSWDFLSFVPDPLTGLSLLVGGAWARTQRADTRIGNLLLLASAAWFAEDLRTLEGPPLVATFGAFFASASLPALAWVGLAFPDGRLPGRAEWAAVLAAALVAGPVGFANILIARERPGNGAVQHFWPIDYQMVSPGADDALEASALLIGASCAIWIVLLIGRRFLRSARPTRRFATPFIGAAVVLSVVIVAHQIVLVAGERDRFNGTMLAIEQGLTVALAMAFPLGLLRLRLARGGLARMLSGLTGGSHAELREGLAGAFDDPELELALWDEGTGRWTDENGELSGAPSAPPGRAVIELERGGIRAGAVVTDETWTLDEDLIRAVGVAASLELDNVRLVAGRRALVDAADAELRRLERDLHDGAQQQLVAVTLHLAEIENGLRRGELPDAPDRLAAVRADLRRALGEVRALGAGGLPPELEDLGLAAAVEGLAHRSPIPLECRVDLPSRPPREIEITAWFVVCEALANAGKHSAATRLRVSARQSGTTMSVEIADDGRGGADAGGRGLRALAERVASVGGRLAVEASPEGGTLVRASLPVTQ